MNIAYFVFNMDGYSGAAFQALTLSEVIQIKEKNRFNIFFFNISPNANMFWPKIYNNRIMLPKWRIMQLFCIIYFFSKYKIKISHLHGYSIIAIISSVILRRSIILKTTLLNYDDFETFNKTVKGRIKIYFLKFY